MTLHNKIALYDSMGTLLDIHEIQKRFTNKKALYFRINYKKHHEFKCLPVYCETLRDATMYAFGYTEILKAELVLVNYVF